MPSKKTKRPRNKMQVGIASDPSSFVDLMSSETTTDIRNNRWFGISFMPYATQREFAAWCAEHVWGLLLPLKPADIKNLKGALAACLEDAQSPLGVGLLMGWRERISRRIRQIDTELRRNGGANWYSPEVASLNVMSAVADTCSENAFLAAHDAFGQAFEAIRETEQRISKGDDYQPIYALVRGMKNHLSAAYAQAIDQARSLGWPEFKGGDIEVSQAVLLRECARQRLVRILATEELDPDDFDRVQAALTEFAEITDGQGIVAASQVEEKMRGIRPEGWTLAKEAVLCRFDNEFPGEVFWSLPMPAIGGISRRAKANGTVGAYATSFTIGRGICDVYKNPTLSELEKLGLAKKDHLRFLVDGDTVYAWNANMATHYTVSHELGIYAHEPLGGYMMFDDEVISSVGQKDALDILFDYPPEYPNIQWETHPYFASVPRLFKKYDIIFGEHVWGTQESPRDRGHAIAWKQFSGGSIGAYHTTLETRRDTTFDVYKNPTVSELEALGLAEGNELRALLSAEDCFAWSAWECIHESAAIQLGLYSHDPIHLNLVRSKELQDIDGRLRYVLTITTHSWRWPSLIDWRTNPYFMSRPRLFTKYHVIFDDRYGNGDAQRGKTYSWAEAVDFHRDAVGGVERTHSPKKKRLR